MKSFQITSSQTLTTNLNFYKNTVTDTRYRICVCPTSKWSELTETKSVPCISSAMCTIRHSLKYHWKWSHSVVSDSASPWTVAYRASPSMGFSRQEYQSGLPFPSPRDLPDPGNQTRVSHIAGRRFTLWAIIKKHKNAFCILEKSNTSFTCGQNI